MSEIKYREAMLGIAIGKKGVGKTFKTLEQMQPILNGNERTGARPRKCLILDVNNEFGDVKKDQNTNFAHIRAMNLSDVKKFTHSPKIEARRVTILKKGGEVMNLDELSLSLKSMLQNFQNGFFLIEDPTKFINDNIGGDLIGAICTQRHKSCDLMLHFQSVGKLAQPKLWANCNWIRLHKTDDSIKKHESKFGQDVTFLFIGEKIVNMEFERGNVHFCVYIDKESGKISGAFNKTMFTKAIEQYLKDNYKIVETFVNQKDIFTGKLIHEDRNKAVNLLIKGYFQKYYGNKA
jgi:hypothetical protein